MPQSHNTNALWSVTAIYFTIFCISSPLCTLGQIGAPRRSALRYCPLPQGQKDRRGKQKRRKTAAVRTIPPCAGWQRAVKCLKRVKSDNKLWTRNICFALVGSGQERGILRLLKERHLKLGGWLAGKVRMGGNLWRKGKLSSIWGDLSLKWSVAKKWLKSSCKQNQSWHRQTAPIIWFEITSRRHFQNWACFAYSFFLILMQQMCNRYISTQLVLQVSLIDLWWIWCISFGVFEKRYLPQICSKQAPID